MSKNICVIGLGYVGLTLSIVLAKKNFQVYGVENNTKVLNKLKKAQTNIHEPNLNKDLKNVLKKNKLLLYSSIPKSNKITTFIITVGTPVKNDKKINLKNLINVAKEVSIKMNNKSLIILRSTVKIGTTNFINEIISKKNKKFDIAFCPERTMEGSAIKELETLPQIIGGLSKKASLRSKEIFNKITSKSYIVSNAKTAEMIKLVDNSQRDLFFSYSNEVAISCDYLNIDANEVINIGKKNYPRTNLFLPGPVGGPCLEKDPYIYVESLRKEKFFPKLTFYGRKNNEDLINHSVNSIFDYFNKIDKKVLKICILGLAFKGNPETADLRGSTVFPLVRCLKLKFKYSKIYGFDYIVPKNDFKTVNIFYLNTIQSSFRKSDLVIFHNNHKKFSKINLKKNIKLMNARSLIYDFWSQFNFKNNKKNETKYISLGKNYLLDDI